MPKIHLVDGTYELFRSYFGAPARTNADGHEVGALRGLLHSMITLLQEQDVTHVGVAFDHVIESFRNDLFDGYKTGAGIPVELSSQFHPAEDVCRALGLTVWPLVEFEADDGLSTMAARFAEDPAVEQVVICTGAVLSRYGHIQNIPDSAEDWVVKVRGAKTLADNLASRRDDAMLYRTLATLRLDAPCDETLGELRWDGPTDDFEDLCAWLGETRAQGRIPGREG